MIIYENDDDYVDVHWDVNDKEEYGPYSPPHDMFSAERVLCHWNKATCLQKGWVYTQRTINVKLLMVLSVNQVMLMTDGFLMNRTRIISIAQNKNIDKSINVHVAIWQNVFIETTNENEKISNEKQNKKHCGGHKI